MEDCSLQASAGSAAADATTAAATTAAANAATAAAATADSSEAAAATAAATDAAGALSLRDLRGSAKVSVASQHLENKLRVCGTEVDPPDHLGDRNDRVALIGGRGC